MNANPDIVSLNEIEVNDSWSKYTDQTEVYKTMLEQRTGVTRYKKWYHRYGSSYTTGLGQLILSKYPFIAISGKVLTAGRSAIDTMISVNGRNINFTSTHLDNVSQANRLAELDQLLPWETTLAKRGSSPATTTHGPRRRRSRR